MIPRIVLTGGPCGGKTTALAHLRETLPNYGITPILVPEMATFVFSSGIRLSRPGETGRRPFQFQVEMIQGQMRQEETMDRFAALTDGRKVMICDRGTIDNLAYAPDAWQDDILSQVGTLGFLKRRYDTIIHLRSLAYGEGYSLDNPSRYESQEAAIQADSRIYDKWTQGPDVPHFVIAHNVSLEKKLDQVTEMVVDVMNGLTPIGL